MKRLFLLPIGDIDLRDLEKLGPPLAQQFHVPWDIAQPALDPRFAHHAERGQYHSTELLSRMHGYLGPECWRLLGVTDYDLYIPILTFVFGEAQMAGAYRHRLRPSPLPGILRTSWRRAITRPAPAQGSGP